jgi:hypothetical protein
MIIGYEWNRGPATLLPYEDRGLKSMSQSSRTAIEARPSGMRGRWSRHPKRWWKEQLSLVYLGLLSIIVLWSTKPPLRTVHRLRFVKTTSLIDARYRDLLRVLPPDPKLGYITDLKPGDEPKSGEYRFQSQYALAPRVLEHSTRPRYVVANLDDPSRLESLCRLHSLRPIAAFPNGVALLEHATEP